MQKFGFGVDLRFIALKNLLPFKALEEDVTCELPFLKGSEERAAPAHHTRDETIHQRRNPFTHSQESCSRYAGAAHAASRPTRPCRFARGRFKWVRAFHSWPGRYLTHTQLSDFSTIISIMLVLWQPRGPAPLLLLPSRPPISTPAFWLDSGHKVLISEGWPTPAHLATWPSCFLHGMRTFLARSRAWFLLVKKVSIFWPWIYNSSAARPSETPTWARIVFRKATHQRAAP